MLQMANVFIFFRFMEDKKTLIHFCTRMSKIHLCVLRVLCGELLSSTQRQLSLEASVKIELIPLHE